MRKTMKKVFGQFDRISANHPVDEALVNVVRQRDGKAEPDQNPTSVARLLDEFTDEQVEYIEARLAENKLRKSNPGENAISQKFKNGDSKSVPNHQELDWFCDKLSDSQRRAIEQRIEEKNLANDPELLYDLTSDYSDSPENSRTYSETAYVPKNQSQSGNQHQNGRVDRRGFAATLFGFITAIFK